MIKNDRIRHLRKSKGYTLKDIAERLGVSEATAQRYESGAIKNVPYDHIVKYAELLSCTPQYIMGWEPEENIELSTEEKYLIMAFRKAPEGMRDAVRVLLRLKEE